MDWDCKDEVQLALFARLEDSTTDHRTDYRIGQASEFLKEIEIKAERVGLHWAAPECNGLHWVDS